MALPNTARNAAVVWPQEAEDHAAKEQGEYTITLVGTHIEAGSNLLSAHNQQMVLGCCESAVVVMLPRSSRDK